MNSKKKIFIAGHKGLVGSAIKRRLELEEDIEIYTESKENLNLLDKEAVLNFFITNKFDEVYLCAARVGGIHANNTYPVNFILENLSIQNNIIESSHSTNVEKLLFLGSSCIYPRDCIQPIKEEYLLSGPLENTNKPYAIAKIAGLITCESFNRQFSTDYRSVMPTNLYGINDNFHLENSHVIPALIKKILTAKKEKSDVVEVWGTGKPKREFLFSDDLADACIFYMNIDKRKIDNSHVNIGTGIDITIKELAELICDVAGYDGKLFFNSNMPDGTPQKLLDVSKINSYGWNAKTSLKEGLNKTIDWFNSSEK